jgi:hypothetical protein
VSHVPVATGPRGKTRGERIFAAISNRQAIRQLTDDVSSAECEGIRTGTGHYHAGGLDLAPLDAGLPPGVAEPNVAAKGEGEAKPEHCSEMRPLWGAHQTMERSRRHAEGSV